MDSPQSPPKRMTRARAAAKAGESTSKTTKIVTAAAKAKSAPSSASTSTRTTTSAKRKARSDDLDSDDEHDEAPSKLQPIMKTARPTRGRPKKVAPEPTEQEDTRATLKTVRTRMLKKPTVQESAKEEPVKPTRGRPRKVQAEPEAPTEATKRTTARTRGATISKPVVKKTVKFQEPEKENIAPSTSSKVAPSKPTGAAGLRSKPIRRATTPTTNSIPPTTASRATQAASKPAATQEKPGKAPLSPKKVTQIPLSRDGSEDELATMEKTPLKPLMKSPVKPPAGILGGMRSRSPTPAENDSTLSANTITLDAPEICTSNVLASPARRPPSSPFKDAMKSPPKRLDGVQLFQTSKAQHNTANGPSPLKTSFLQSPAKRPQSPLKRLDFSTNSRPEQPQTQSPFKMSLLQSPAKRPISSARGLVSPGRREMVADPMLSPATEPLLLSKPVGLPAETAEPLEQDEVGCDAQGEDGHKLSLESAARLLFPGRLSAVLPRHADPALVDSTFTLGFTPEEPEMVQTLNDSQLDSAVDQAEDNEFEQSGEPMAIDEPEDPIAVPSPAATTPPNSPPKRPVGMFGLRQKDLNPFGDIDSDSEDELAMSGRRHLFNGSSPYDAVLATPTPATHARTPRTGAVPSARQASIKPRLPKAGFTPLAQQFGAWAAASPIEYEASHSTQEAFSSEVTPADPVAMEESPMKNTFFDDEMEARVDPEILQQVEAAVEADINAQIQDPVFDDIPVTEEDVALAAEANEMSLLEPAVLGEMINQQGYDDSLSEASQEYGDENEIPVDPALMSGHNQSSVGVPPVTPARVLTKTFHTVSKVPLKPADDSTPRPKKKRAASISRLPLKRPTNTRTRNATVISYSPMKDAAFDMDEETAPATPAKSDLWSTMGTPARTPRRDLNPSLLSGVVAFVDVYTSEGADASGIFVELLTQMGARCVKSWAWNPTSPPRADGTSSRVGITHVVYKDGGKRTLEKIRETHGVVQCVGVSWVLE
jgi:hypothetical protein